MHANRKIRHLQMVAVTQNVALSPLNQFNKMWFSFVEKLDSVKNQIKSKSNAWCAASKLSQSMQGKQAKISSKEIPSMWTT